MCKQLLTVAILVLFRDELPEILQEKGRRRSVVFDSKRNVWTGIAKNVNSFIVRYRSQRSTIH